MKFEIMDNSCTFVTKLRQSFDITISVSGIFLYPSNCYYL